MAEKLPQSAQDAVLESIDALLAQNEHALTIPLTKINEAVAKVVTNNAKVVEKFTTKILRAADKQLVANEDRLHGAQMTILNGIDAWLSDQHLLLSQLASKGGLMELGEPLAAALTKEATEGKQLTYEGTLVLKVAEAVPWLERIAIAIEKIAASFDAQSVPSPSSNLGDSAAGGTDIINWDESSFDGPLV
jgi:hypothetical protein